jgi:hypothetical protein
VRLLPPTTARTDVRSAALIDVVRAPAVVDRRVMVRVGCGVSRSGVVAQRQRKATGASLMLLLVGGGVATEIDQRAATGRPKSSA